MPRKPRLFDPNWIYHLTHRGDHQQKVFFDNQDYRRFLTLVEESQNRFGFALFHYCLMPNHVHMEARPEKCNLSAAMHHIFNGYTKYFCRRHGHKGHLWQERFHDKPIESEAHLFATGQYIELNPVSAGLVKSPTSWKYSSIHHHGGLKREKMLNDYLFLDDFGGDAVARAEQYLERINKVASRINLP